MLKTDGDKSPSLQFVCTPHLMELRFSGCQPEMIKWYFCLSDSGTYPRNYHFYSLKKCLCKETIALVLQNYFSYNRYTFLEILLQETQYENIAS